MNADAPIRSPICVIAAILEASNTLGAGFLEKVYERALIRELGLRSITGFKCVERLSNEHLAQCLNYLQVSGRSVCLSVNFQRPKADFAKVPLVFR